MGRREGGEVTFLDFFGVEVGVHGWARWDWGVAKGGESVWLGVLYGCKWWEVEVWSRVVGVV